MTQGDEALREAEQALVRGDPEGALAAAARSGDAGYRAILEGQAFMDLGMYEAARGALGRASAKLDPDDPDLIDLQGEFALSHWEIETARTLFETLLRAEPESVIAHHRLALLCDLAGDAEGADGYFAAVADVDPDHRAPVRLDQDAFAEIVDRALADLPPMFLASLENVRVVTEPVPFRELVDPTNVAETPPDILGLFVGPTIHDLAEDGSAELPPTIYLFQRNIENGCATLEELEREIRVTLFHEIGHLLGLDEDEVAAMGLA